MKNEYEENIKQHQDQNDLLKQHLKDAKGLNVEHTHKIAILEEQLKYFKLIYVTSSFSKFT